MQVTTARDCTWSAISHASWVGVAPVSGQGSGTITLSVAGNPDTRLRTASIAVNDSMLTVTQEGLPCRFQLPTQQVRVAADGARTSIGLTTTDGCDWRATAAVPWVRVLTDHGTGAASVEIDVSRNDGFERSGTLSIAGLTFTVHQDGTPDAPPMGPAPASCSFAIDSDRASFRSAGGQGSIRITADPGCPWTAAAHVPWLTLARASGVGSETLQYSVAQHTSTTNDRSGTLNVAGRTHTVEQQACGLSIDPPSQTFNSPGGEGSIRITTDPGCQWSASATGGWVALSRSSGGGPDSLKYQVGVNTSTTSERSGTVAISGRTHAVRQLPYRPQEIAAEGVLLNVSGSCAGFTFVVGGYVFVTDSRTAFDACDKVRTGIRAYVRGDLLADGRVLATRVEIDD